MSRVLQRCIFKRINFANDFIIKKYSKVFDKRLESQSQQILIFFVKNTPLIEQERQTICNI